MNEYKDAMKRSSPDVVVATPRGSIFQHGPQNDRIYLMKLAAGDEECVMAEMSRLAAWHGYTKLFCKVCARVAPLFFADGYLLEGHIPGFYDGREDAFFVSKFLNEKRCQPLPREEWRTLYELLQTAPNAHVVDSEYTVRELDEGDISAVANLYEHIFESYPFPIYDPAYIAQSMCANVWYFGAFKGGELAALASSEIDFDTKSAEMTDFATHHTHTGRHLSCLLLDAMEYRMQQMKIVTLYTIARLRSIPMNKTFIRAGYKYAGTLINNTHISGDIESMNLYYKRI